MMNGQGIMKSGSGKIYEGSFLDNHFNGIGKQTWPDGSTYEGDWHMNKMQGDGVYRWPNGKVYKGQFFEGLRDGKVKRRQIYLKN